MIVFPKIFFWIGAIVVLIATAIAAVLMEPVLLLIPFFLFGLIYLVQTPVILFYILLFTIPWSVEYNFPSGLGTDLPDEPLMLFTSFAAIILFIVQFKSFNKTKINALSFLLLMHFFWMISTVITSTHFILSAKYFLAKSWYLLAFFVMPVFLWRDKQVLKRSAVILFLSMLLVTIVGLVRHANLGFTFANINKAVFPFFRNHVNYSALLVFMIPIQVVFWHGSGRKAIKQLLLLSLLITLTALYFSFARGAWLALMVGIFAWYLFKHGWLLKSFIITVLLVIISVFWLKQNNRYLQFAHNYQHTIFHEDFNQHLSATYQLKDMSTAERFYRWIAGIRMIDDSWQTGFGPTTFYEHYKSYTVPAFKTWVSQNKEHSTVHNYFLLLVVEQGAVSLLLFLLLIGTAFGYAQNIYKRTTDVFWKHCVTAIAIILVMQCIVNFLSDLIETDKVGSVFYMCLAALVIADFKTREIESNAASSKNQV